MVRRAGRLDPALLADRPTEERARTAWSLTWALPRSAAVRGACRRARADPERRAAALAGPARRDVPAGPGPPARRCPARPPTRSSRRPPRPTPTCSSSGPAAGDGIWTLVPVGPARRRPRRRAARAGCCGSCRTGRAALRSQDRRACSPAPRRRRAGAAGAAPTRTSWPRSPPLSPGWSQSPRQAAAVLALLGVRRLPLGRRHRAAAARRQPGSLARPVHALAGLAADPLAREALAALPVPLADGRVVRGVRGVILPDGSPRWPPRSPSSGPGRCTRTRRTRCWSGSGPGCRPARGAGPPRGAGGGARRG